MVDCSHGNSGKNHEQQPIVFQDVFEQRLAGNKGIVAMMVESNLVEGAQNLNGSREDLEYGKSVTDQCVGRERTEILFRDAHRFLPEVVLSPREQTALASAGGQTEFFPYHWGDSNEGKYLEGEY
jgi:3-deoxy-D-arabino-heptulosonate 7-phosphate (DAHP) synthase